MRLDVLDDFAGPGGWDEGALSLGLRAVGVETDEAACSTAAAAGHLRIRADAETYPSEPFSGVRGYVASPPCKDFSTAGPGLGEQGATGRLVRVPLARALALMPEWIAWEQVPTVLPIWREAAHILRGHGYSVWCGVLDAARFGVPQHRRRAVLLGSRVRPVAPPAPTHDLDTGGLFPLLPVVTLADVLRLRPGWIYDSGQNSVLGGGRIARYRRSCDRPAGTLTTKATGQWVLRGPDGERRKLTLQDAARLQTFRPDYPFAGGHEKRREQIGNAVPPVFAARLISAASGVALASEAAA